MVIDVVEQHVAYYDLHPANVSTLFDPTSHVPSERVPSIILDAAGVERGRYSRRALNRCCDDMLADFALQCNLSGHPSWNFFGDVFHACFDRFFKEDGDVNLVEVRASCGERFRLLWQRLCCVYE